MTVCMTAELLAQSTAREVLTLWRPSQTINWHSRNANLPVAHWVAKTTVIQPKS